MNSANAPQVVGALTGLGMIYGSELGRSIAKEAQCSHEDIRTAEAAGIFIANTLVVAATDALFPESATLYKICTIGLTLFTGGLSGFASGAEKANVDYELPSLSQEARENAAKWDLAGMVAGGILAGIGTVALHPAVGPLIGGVTVFAISKYGTLVEAKKDYVLHRA